MILRSRLETRRSWALAGGLAALTSWACGSAPDEPGGSLPGRAVKGSGGQSGGSPGATTGGVTQAGSGGSAIGSGGEPSGGAPTGGEPSTGAGAGGAPTGGSEVGGTGGSVSEPGGSGGSGGSGGAGGVSGGGEGACADYVGSATPQETALTPRADVDVEILALRASGEVVAPTEIYQQIAEDLAGIRAEVPALAEIHPRPIEAPSSLNVELDDAGLALLEQGAYDAWNCPNALYRVMSLGQPSSQGVVSLLFRGRYRMLVVRDDYRELEHVVSASTPLAIGGGDDVCIRVEGMRLDYLFDHGSGDCPAGCINHNYWGFSSEASGEITLVGTSQDDTLSDDWKNQSPFICGEDLVAY